MRGNGRVFSAVLRPVFEYGGLVVGENIGLNQVGGARALKKAWQPAERPEDIGLHASSEAVTDGFIAVIESRTFIRECIRRSMQSALPLHVQTFSEVEELQRDQLPSLILISEIKDKDNRDSGA